MSLVVSLRVPDGIVVAADSLSTAHNVLEVVSPNVEFDCPNCKVKISGQQVKLPPVPVPISASSFTQKLFPLFNKYAISTFGLGVINNRSIYYHVRQFASLNRETDYLPAIRDKFIEFIESELLIQFPRYKDEAPEDWFPLGFHINGYEDIEKKPVGITYEIHLGRKKIIQRRDTTGCTIGGEGRLVQKLWEIGKEDVRRQLKYPLFSLQDAIDLSEFLIGATSTFQRFTNEVQTVGGEVDIALLTPFEGFQWIKRKKLMERLEA